MSFDTLHWMELFATYSAKDSTFEFAKDVTNSGFEYKEVMIYQNIKLFIATLLLAAAFGCSTKTPQTSVDSEFRIGQLELYLARGSLRSSDYESYVRNGDQMLVECGSLHQGRRLARLTEVVPFSSAQSDHIHEQYLEEREVLQRREWSLDQPGEVNGMFEPGTFQLRVVEAGTQQTELNFETSLDAISEPDREVEKSLLALAETIRGSVSTAPCNNKSFYGVGMR